jgi:tetratricopeptide (TPR) repeat protein
MKKLLVLFGVLLSLQTYAQKSAIQTAINYLGYGELDKAKTAIDGAAVNETTIGLAKTWNIRSRVYTAILESKDPKYAALKEGAIDEALKSYEKTMELDAKKEYEDENKPRLYYASSQYMNDGVDAFKDGKYEMALAKFKKSSDISSKYLGRTDTLALFNAALAADKGGKTQEAMGYYNQLTDMNYGGARTFTLLSQMQLQQKDTAAALVTINKGRQKYPDDNNLIIQGLNIYLSSGRDKEAFDQLDAAIAKDPNNANLHYAKGTLADKLGKGDLASASYKKALEIKPDFFDAAYNLGAMYFNQAAELANKANDIPANKVAEYEAAKKKFEAKFKEAQPYLEMAHSLNSKDEATMQSLRQLYGRIGDMQKATEIKKKLDALKK